MSDRIRQLAIQYKTKPVTTRLQSLKARLDEAEKRQQDEGGNALSQMWHSLRASIEEDYKAADGLLHLKRWASNENCIQVTGERDCLILIVSLDERANHVAARCSTTDCHNPDELLWERFFETTWHNGSSYLRKKDGTQTLYDPGSAAEELLIDLMSGVSH